VLLSTKDAGGSWEIGASSAYTSKYGTEVPATCGTSTLVYGTDALGVSTGMVVRWNELVALG
jgi:hypothetical protein